MINKISKLLPILFVILVFCHPLNAADQASAFFDVSGNVPTYFSVSTRGIPGDLDLTPNVVVNNRLIGLVHFKYNENVASMIVSSNTLSGGPETSVGGGYSFQGGGFQVSVAAGCASVNPIYNSPFVLTHAGIDVKSALAAALINTGIEEDCQVLASWTGTSQSLPLAGVYSLNVQVIMTSM